MLSSAVLILAEKTNFNSLSNLKKSLTSKADTSQNGLSMQHIIHARIVLDLVLIIMKYKY